MPYTDLRIGGVFLDFAADIKAAHFEYCAIHAKFVDLIEKYKYEMNVLNDIIHYIKLIYGIMLN